MRTQNLISLTAALVIHFLAFYFLMMPKFTDQSAVIKISNKSVGSHHFIISDFSLPSKPRSNSATATSKKILASPTLSNESRAVHSEFNEAEMNGKSSESESATSESLYDSLPLPTYPRLAREKAMEGIVKISASYDQNGAITNIQLSQSSGHQLLDSAVINTVREWKIHASSSGHFEKSFEFKLR